MKFPRLVHSSWLDPLFPRSCLGCDAAVDRDSAWDYLCGPCVERMDWIHPPFCQTCGHPFPGIGRGQRCSHCELLEPVYASGRCCLLHRELAARLVREIKYHDARYLERDIQSIGRKIRDLPLFVEGAVAVPVPLHPVRERERGFNQSHWLAEAWAGVLPLAGVEPLLERIRWTATQTRLAREERARNMRDAFRLRTGAEVRRDLTYIVVDDVFTTGATLNECCRTLRRAGARSLKVLTLAHG